MWESEEEREKQRQLEKLIDWELNKRLTWAVVFLTSILGLVALLASGLLRQWVDFSSFPLITLNLVKAPFVVIFFVLLVFGVDVSFYRLATSAVRMRNYAEWLTRKLYRQELMEKAVFKGFTGLFVEKTEKNTFSLRIWFVCLLVVIGDILFIWALFSLG